MAFLVQLTDGVPAGEYPVGDVPVTLGRQSDNTVVLKDSRVSRKHAKIETTATGVVLTDLESTHLTYVNAEPQRSAVLKHGDRVSVAQVFDFLFFDHRDDELLQKLVAGIPSPSEGDEGPYSTLLTQEMGELLNSLKGEAEVDAKAAQQLGSKMRKVVQELRSIYDITNAISAETDVQKVLELVVSHVIKATKAEHGFVMLFDEAGKQLVPVTARTALGPLTGPERTHFSQTLARKAVETGTTLVSKDTSADPEMASKSVVDYNIRSCICAPLKVKSKTIGCLYVDAKESIKSFSEKDVEFYNALTGQAAIAIENARLFSKLNSANRALTRKLSELEAMFAVSQKLTTGSGQTEVLETVLDQAIKTVGSSRGSIMLYVADTDELEVAVARGTLDPKRTERIRLHRGEGIAGHVAATAQGLIVNQGAKDPRFLERSPRDADIKQMICVPLAGKEGTIGTLTLVNRRQGEFNQDDLHLLTNLAHHAAVSIENAKLYNLAVFDGLTKVHVVRYFNAWMDKEINKALRYGNELSLMLMDVDHFKRFNDTYGHQTGDQVLVELARIFKEQARTSDLVARYGGEEFVIALPETDLPGAETFAERLRKRVEDHRIVTASQQLKVTISIGICNLKVSGLRTRDELVKAADGCLYQAKGRGRNCVVSFKPALSSRELAEQVKQRITSGFPAIKGGSKE